MTSLVLVCTHQTKPCSSVPLRAMLAEELERRVHGNIEVVGDEKMVPAPLLFELSVSYNTPMPAQCSAFTDWTRRSKQSPAVAVTHETQLLLDAFDKYCAPDRRGRVHHVAELQYFEQETIMKARPVFAGEIRYVPTGIGHFMPCSWAVHPRHQDAILLHLLPGESVFLLMQAQSIERHPARRATRTRALMDVKIKAEVPPEKYPDLLRACSNRPEFNGLNVFELNDIEDLKKGVRVANAAACTACMQCKEYCSLLVVPGMEVDADGNVKKKLESKNKL